VGGFTVKGTGHEKLAGNGENREMQITNWQ
jgi:hypothetical protein